MASPLEVEIKTVAHVAPPGTAGDGTDRQALHREGDNLLAVRLSGDQVPLHQAVQTLLRQDRRRVGGESGQKEEIKATKSSQHSHDD